MVRETIAAPSVFDEFLSTLYSYPSKARLIANRWYWMIPSVLRESFDFPAIDPADLLHCLVCHIHCGKIMHRQ
ncbi:hypothetical protein [Prevotella brunnea]|uniref:hypothetical protein n=1 Tax=Prevotella brunnea TaxID=2508867 RepID=UPI00187522BD|nr:hypothetical protein [Prevotella brunnea]